MPDGKLDRRAFFQKLANIDTTDAPDALFKKYSRKEPVNSIRRYSSYEQYLENIDGEGQNNETAERVGVITSGLAPYTGAWTEWQVIHLLKRTGFGNRKTDVTALSAMTMSNAVNALTTINNTPSLPSATPLNYYQSTNVDPAIALGADWTANNLTYSTATASNDGPVNSVRNASHNFWTWGLWLNDGPSIREKMVSFWYHFIPVSYGDIAGMVNNSATLMQDYMKLLRNNALGNFKTLIKAIAKSPAMLVYLSNHYSTAAAPNENFARELMELFTMGKFPSQNFTEADVQNAAKVFSGWRVSAFTTAYPFVVSFNPTYHNQSNKVFSSNFGPNAAINNITGPGGAAEFDTFFDMLFQEQSVTISKYIARRLYRFFVYYDIDVNIETNVITPLAAALVSNSWNILPVMNLLLKSEHFYDMANRGVMIKSPFDMIAGVLKTLEVNTNVAAGTTQLFNQYKVWENLNNQAKNNLEQGLGLAPTVSGWKAYYQEPTFYQNWINANTIQKRSVFLTSLINGYTVSTHAIKIDAIAFLQQFPSTSIELPGWVVDTFIKYLLSLDLPQTFKEELKVQTLLSGQVTDSYWTTAWAAFAANPNTTNRTTVNNKLKALVSAILQLAEFQLM